MAEDNSRYFALPAPPGERPCDFCDERSVESFVLEMGKLYVYACSSHLDHAEQSVNGRRAGRPKCSRDQDERLFSIKTLPAVDDGYIR